MKSLTKMLISRKCRKKRRLLQIANVQQARSGIRTAVASYIQASMLGMFQNRKPEEQVIPITRALDNDEGADANDFAI